MKYPKHLINDVDQIKHLSFSGQYWILNFFFQLDLPTTYLNLSFDKLYFSKKFLKKKQAFLPARIRNKQKFFTFKYSQNESHYFLTKNVKKKIINNFKTKAKVNNRQNFSKNIFKNIYYNLHSLNKFDKYALNRIFQKISFKGKKKLISNLNQSFITFKFDISFLKKEKMYTKLKYSRVPQYDIVSGASAALSAGFLGFLVCEKFGFELLDSGDFYFIFMYLVFFFFLSRLFLKLINYEKEKFFLLSLKFFFLYYKNIFFIIFSFFL